MLMDELPPGGNGTKTSLFHSPKFLRNICVMAHVDHGKTTLADALVASNGIITKRQAGKIRYMDSRKDEIERGITMKSSCITLTYPKSEGCYVVNLIDSPGHVDFSSEVSTAVRLCDGTIIVVDVVEGVCAQTKVVLKQAWLENIKPVLVLNKLDRLILEMKLTPIDAFYHIAQILEQVNAFMGELFNTDVSGRCSSNDAEPKERRHRTTSGGRRTSECNTTSVQISDWFLTDVDDSEIYFSPEAGNVVFASAVDGWGFRLDYFANKFSSKLGVEPHELKSALWGDFYAATKKGKKCILDGARQKRKSPLFVSVILDNIYKVYDTIMERKDSFDIDKMATSLGIKLPIHVAKSTDHRAKVSYIFGNWLPLANTVLDMVVEELPSAADVTEVRARKLMCSATQRFDSLPEETQRLKSAFCACQCADDAPLIVYVSKMFGVEQKFVGGKETRMTKRLHASKKGLISMAELQQRRDHIRSKEAATNGESGAVSNAVESVAAASSGDPVGSIEGQKEGLGTHDPAEEDKEVLIAFARVFSGTLKVGQKIYVLGPKHNPHSVMDSVSDDGQITEEVLQDFEHIKTCVVRDLYLLMGRELQSVRSAPAGAMVGIGGMEDYIIKSATLSSTPFCAAFTELTLQATPILRVAVEPSDAKDLPRLRRGLKILNQADPCVEVLLQESGEYVIVTAGEVHLQRCIDDLQERYAKVPVTASPPIVPFRETVVPLPTTDRLNEAIQGENVIQKKADASYGVAEADGSATKLKIRCVPLPPVVTSILEENSHLLCSISSASVSNVVSSSSSSDASAVGTKKPLELSEDALASINSLKVKLKAAFNEAGTDWQGAMEQLWTVGPHYSGPNILLNRIPNYERTSLFYTESSSSSSSTPPSPLSQYDANFVTGFQLATAAGPLCEEPMMGVAFIVERWRVDPSMADSGQIISHVKDTIRKAFINSPQRLMCAMYSCNITVTSEVIGKMYNVIGKRQGRILDGDITEGSTSWNITAYLPVIESFNFANELRKSTSGEAMPQLIFSHWETLNIDPFWEPQTTEELAHWGEKADSANLARQYINSVRVRKGLATDDKIVEHAEKQRNLSKNK